MYKAPIITLFLGFIFILDSCSVQKGYVKFDNNTENEIIGSDVIKQFMKRNPKPSIVVTAPNTKEKSTESDKNSYIYNVIEKELLQAGFDVKDRGLYNEVVGKSKEINYSELKKLTGTDIILELVRINTDVLVKTNKYYQKDGKEMIYNGHAFSFKGASIEFKLTLIDGNRYAGSYTFNFAPCRERTYDCKCEVAYKTMPLRVYPKLSFCKGNRKKVKEGYESVSTSEMAEFVKTNIRVMIKDIKGN